MILFSRKFILRKVFIYFLFFFLRLFQVAKVYPKDFQNFCHRQSSSREFFFNFSNFTLKGRLKKQNTKYPESNHLMKTHLAHLTSPNKLNEAIIVLILLTPYVWSYDHENIRAFTTVLHVSPTEHQGTVLRSNSLYRNEIYKIYNNGSRYGKALFLDWIKFSLQDGRMPTCSDAYLKVSTG